MIPLWSKASATKESTAPYDFTTTLSALLSLIPMLQSQLQHSASISAPLPIPWMLKAWPIIYSTCFLWVLENIQRRTSTATYFFLKSVFSKKCRLFKRLYILIGNKLLLLSSSWSVFWCTRSLFEIFHRSSNVRFIFRTIIERSPLITL